MRFRSRIRRRVYDVKSPQELWHIDGNHKLIRWRFVVHGGIDGYSRLPVFLKCSSTNSADRVLEYFLEAVEQYGLPVRVRSDKGGENIRVAEYMWSQEYATVGNRMIMGRSVHNQRIERLWRDLFEGCLSLYYQLFLWLESNGHLDPSNEKHLFALHYIYQPRIQKSLDHFRQAYINHPLSACQNRTPAQLFVAGALPFINESTSSLDDQQIHMHGIDLTGPVQTGSVENVVVVPEIEIQEDNLRRLQQYIDNADNSDSDYGIFKYITAVRLMSYH